MMPFSLVQSSASGRARPKEGSGIGHGFSKRAQALTRASSSSMLKLRRAGTPKMPWNTEMLLQRCSKKGPIHITLCLGCPCLQWGDKRVCRGLVPSAPNLLKGQRARTPFHQKEVAHCQAGSDGGPATCQRLCGGSEI